MLSPCCLMHADDVMQSKVHPLHLATGELGEALGGKWGGRALEGVRGIIRGSTMLLWHMQHYAPVAYAALWSCGICSTMVLWHMQHYGPVAYAALCSCGICSTMLHMQPCSSMREMYGTGCLIPCTGPTGHWDRAHLGVQHVRRHSPHSTLSGGTRPCDF